ncbi:MAG: LysE family translocator [Bacteroidetes bacterium]|nr:LysE family translocator [Bacteroidota bacterium]
MSIKLLHPLFEGLILGITVAITLGPALVALLQTSIKHGIKTGIFLAFGIFISDLFLVVGAFYGVSEIITAPKYHLIFGLLGGVVMIAFGIYTFFRKIPPSDTIEPINEFHVKRKGVIPYFFKGFLLNVVNPSLWFFWIFWVVSINSTYGGDRKSVALFFAGALGMILATDILKVVLANKIKVLGNPNVKFWINRVVGILFFIFGAFIITGTLMEYLGIHFRVT